jgi:hypothetical protein
MNNIAASLEKEYPDNNGWGVRLVSLHDEAVGNSRPALLILVVAVALVLLIICVNLANLLLARSAVRVREMAMRKALGASRRRLLSQLLTESLLLSMGGAILGLWVASLGDQRTDRDCPHRYAGDRNCGIAWVGPSLYGWNRISNGGRLRPLACGQNFQSEFKCRAQ